MSCKCLKRLTIRLDDAKLLVGLCVMVIPMLKFYGLMDELTSLVKPLVKLCLLLVHMP